MSTETERFWNGINNPNNKDDISEVIAAALRLERALYYKEPHGPFLFRLRKTLEGIWGHDLPVLDEYGNEIPDDGGGDE